MQLVILRCCAFFLCEQAHRTVHIPTEVVLRFHVFVTQHPQPREQFRELVGVEHDRTSDRVDLRHVAMKALDHDDATGLETANDAVNIFTGAT